MKHDPEILKCISDYLDDCISDEDLMRLESWIKASAENRSYFVRESIFHDRLASRLRMASLIETDREKSSRRPFISFPAYRSRRLLSGIAASLLLVFFSFWWLNTSELDAAAGLDQLIAKTSDLGDRTYSIGNLDRFPEKNDGRRPPIDGARLYVRGQQQYVLVRQFPDGRKFSTGFDGRQNWAAPPDGAVRLSNDPNRFRGPLPGHKHGVPFVDLKSDLIEIRNAFSVSFLEGKNGMNRLFARKKRGVRGPRDILIQYDEQTGIIHEMIFRGLPQQQGGPSSVVLSLISQDTLDPSFFEHSFHHDPERQVVQE
jgi:hypothetical protein